MEIEKRTEVLERLSEVLSLNNIFTDESLSRHTSFKIGGPCDFFVIAEDETELTDTISICDELCVRYLLLGNGTNVLVSDEGFSGVVIKLMGKFSEITIEEKINDGEALITAGAGVLLSKLSMFSLKKGFSGLEFAGGIPGSVGGAVYMNAGAYGHSVSDVIKSVVTLREDGKMKEYTCEEAKFSYRKSVFADNNEIILFARFLVKVYPRIPIRVVMERYRAERAEKQPLELPSAGSFFKRPEGNFAGKLIEEAGLKGYRTGDAGVSEKHAGFIVNYGNATFDDVIKVMQHVIDTVYDKFKVKLEPEVKIIK